MFVLVCIIVHTLRRQCRVNIAALVAFLSLQCPRLPSARCVSFWNVCVDFWSVMLNGFAHWSSVRAERRRDLSFVVCCSFRHKSTDISLKALCSDSRAHWSGRNITNLSTHEKVWGFLLVVNVRYVGRWWYFLICWLHVKVCPSIRIHCCWGNDQPKTPGRHLMACIWTLSTIISNPRFSHSL